MGRAVRDIGSNDSLARRVKKKAKDNEAVKKHKRKKHKSELDEIHQKILKAKDLLDGRAKKSTKKKSEAPKKICNRILPQPSGIYRNGARGREIRKKKEKLAARDFDNARLESDVFKLVKGEESNPQYVNKEDIVKEILIDSDDTIPSTSKEPTRSPTLGKLNKTRKKECRESVTPQNVLVHEVSSDDSDLEPLEKYEKLCTSIVENFKLRSHGITADRLGAVKSKLRNIYADTFSNNLLRKKIREGINPDDPEIPSPRTSSTDDCYFSWNNWRTPESKRTPMFLQCSQVDALTPFAFSEKPQPNTRDNRQSDSAYELSGNYENANHKKSSQTKLFDFASIRNQRDDVLVKQNIKTLFEKEKEVDTMSNSSSDTIKAHSTLSNTTKCVIYESDENDNAVFLPQFEKKIKNLVECTLTRNLAKTRSKSVSFHTNAGEKKFNCFNLETDGYSERVKHVPSILRKKKIVQAVKSYPSTKNRSRKVVDVKPGGEKYVESLFFDPQNVQTPTAVNEILYKYEKQKKRDDPGRTKSQNPFISIERSNSLVRDSSSCSYKFLTENKETTLPPQHEDIVYIRRNARNCSHSSNSHQMEPQKLDTCKIPKQLFIQQETCSQDYKMHSHKCQDTRVPYKHPELQERRQDSILYEDKPYREHIVFYPRENCAHCSTDSIPKGQRGKLQPAMVYYRGNVPDASILDGVEKLQILNDERDGSRVSCQDNINPSSFVFTDSAQPVKYLAFEESSRTKRVPIYPQENSYNSSETTEGVLNPKRNYHVACSQNSQGFVLVPACKQSGQVVYVNEKGHNFLLKDPPQKLVCLKDKNAIKHHAHCERKPEEEAVYILVNEHDRKKMPKECNDACCEQRHSKVAR